MNSNSKKNCLVICGPTASGKTTLGVRLALARNGEIISCDSRQVYRGMDIGTGKDLSEYQTSNGTIPFHCIDIVDPAAIYTVYHYQRDFYAAFSDITSRNKLPIIVGGSGLYLEAVLRDYKISSVPEDPALRDNLMRKEKDWLDEELLRLDPNLHATTDRTSKKRIVRSLEIAMAKSDTSVPPSSSLQRPHIDPLVLCVTWDRPLLHRRIEVRLKSRLENGMIDEVKRLLDTGIPASRFSLFGMEYKHIAQYLQGEVDYDTMVKNLFQSIRHFAKRQETWFRGMERRGVKMVWVKEGRFEEAETIVKESVITYPTSTISR